jgi:hypothetical protein
MQAFKGSCRDENKPLNVLILIGYFKSGHASSSENHPFTSASNHSVHHVRKQNAKPSQVHNSQLQQIAPVTVTVTVAML